VCRHQDAEVFRGEGGNRLRDDRFEHPSAEVKPAKYGVNAIDPGELLRVSDDIDDPGVPAPGEHHQTLVAHTRAGVGVHRPVQLHGLPDVEANGVEILNEIRRRVENRRILWAADSGCQVVPVIGRR
jgi:hypothetical protein